jgi:hypothetical protein
MPLGLTGIHWKRTGTECSSDSLFTERSDGAHPRHFRTGFDAIIRTMHAVLVGNEERRSTAAVIAAASRLRKVRLVSRTMQIQGTMLIQPQSNDSRPLSQYFADALRRFGSQWTVRLVASWAGQIVQQCSSTGWVMRMISPTRLAKGH